MMSHSAGPLLSGLSRWALIAAAMLPAPLLAAEADAGAEAGDDTIIVTGLVERGTAAGTKSDVPLIRTAQSITIIDKEELTARNVTSINQALGYVAGVATNQRGAMVTRYDQLILRGFAPGIFLDGMRLIAGPYSTPQTDFNRVDHIDIVKGPASVLYGNSTPGGLVNLTSKTPQATPSGQVELQLGNFKTRRAVADVNQPLTENGTILARVVGGWQKGDGLTQGTFAERWHVSPMITFAPTDATSLTIIGVYQHAPSGGGYSGVPAYGSVLPNPLGRLPRNINTGDPGYERYNHKQKAVTTLFRHEFSDQLTLRSNIRYQNNKLSYRQIYVAGFATTGTGVNRQTNYGIITRGGGGADEDFDTFTTDNHLNAKFETGAFSHNLLVGVDYQNIKGENFQQFNSGVTTNPLTSIPNLSLFAPVYGGTLPSFDLTVLSPTAYVNQYSKRHQTGLYAQDQISIGALQLIASGRYDMYRQDTLNKRNSTTTKLSQNAFTMRLGALYAFDFGLSPYASYSESFEPQTGSTYLGAPFDPVTGRQYEAGLKFQPKGLNALFTASIYDLRRQKVPVGDPLAGTGAIPANSQVQIGEVRVRGVELEGRGSVAPGFDLIAALSYTSAIITQGTPAAGITPTTTGTRQLGTPKWGASTFLTYDLAKADKIEGPLGGFKFGAGIRHVAGSDGITTYAVVNGASVFQRFHTKSFTLVDALLSYDLSRIDPRMEGVSLAVNAANLFDKRHVSACPFTNSCYFGAARTVIGSLRYNW